MKITDVRTVFADKYLFVEVETDTGIVGLGECGAFVLLEACAACVQIFKRMILGMDPLQREHISQYILRSYHFRGAVVSAAVSAIDIALWDIAGKHYDAPVWQLMGGKCRDRARAYYHVWGATTEELVEGCIDAKRKGFTAVGHLSPFLDEPRTKPYEETFTQKIGRGAERVCQFRKAVGEEVDLCIEMHRRCTVHEAVSFAREIAQFRPIFIEDPVRPENFDDMAQVAAKTDIPIATGERFLSGQEFAMLLSGRCVNYARPDLCLCGGLTGAKKIAALSEAFGVQIVPHNPLSPVSTAACLQIAACIPNFALLEYPGGDDVPPKSEIIHTDVVVKDGYLIVPDTPGIGARLIPGAAEKYPPIQRNLITRLAGDGSVVDQ